MNNSPENSNICVNSNDFEGPIDLLLDLIEKRKLQINTLSLSEITDDFLAKLKERQVFPVDLASHFLYVASTLVFIKSKSLLPVLSYLEEEEIDANVLSKRLEMYQTVRNVGDEVLGDGLKSVMRTRKAGRDKKYKVMFRPDTSMDRESILKILENIIFILPKKDDLREEVVEVVISIDEMMDNLIEKLKRINGHVCFDDLADNSTKSNTIVSFLALLELVKQEQISVNQSDRFGSIEVTV